MASPAMSMRTSDYRHCFENYCDGMMYGNGRLRWHPLQIVRKQIIHAAMRGPDGAQRTFTCFWRADGVHSTSGLIDKSSSNFAFFKKSCLFSTCECLTLQDSPWS